MTAPTRANDSHGGNWRTSVARSMADIDPVAWDRLSAAADNPFVEHAFLLLLEESHSVGGRTGWIPRHIVVHEDGALVAGVPCYVRRDSFGEYIFDWRWAEAAARFGVGYYPKITSAVPFTPATGPRLLCAAEPGTARAQALLAALQTALLELAQAEQASSVHVLYCQDDEASTLARHSLHRRKSLQFHWRNDGYASFDDFLNRLRHEERKQIRRERRRVQESGLQVEARLGGDVDPTLWPQIFALYTSTSGRKWGRPYLTERFFTELPRAFAERALVCTASKDGDVVAMTLSFEKGRHIYGRYWGSSVDVPGLHFELCYYQLIERAIERGMSLVEAGAQGEHKLKRGFLPVITHSAHRMLDPTFDAAVARSLKEEAVAVDAEQAELVLHGPFKEGTAPPHPLVAGIVGL